MTGQHWPSAHDRPSQQRTEDPVELQSAPVGKQAGPASTSPPEPASSLLLEPASGSDEPPSAGVPASPPQAPRVSPCRRCACTAGEPTVMACALARFPGGMWQMVTLSVPLVPESPSAAVPSFATTPGVAPRLSPPLMRDGTGSPAPPHPLENSVQSTTSIADEDTISFRIGVLQVKRDGLSSPVSGGKALPC